MKHLLFIFLFSTISLSCASNPLEKQISIIDTNEKDDDKLNDNPEIQSKGDLIADGNDANTYNLITSCGYNYETPDYSGEHATNPFRHIKQSYDDELKKYIFDIWLHIDNDDDRGQAAIKDRQRNEIKTDAKSPSYMIAYQGETLKISWKFKLPADMKTTNKFSHIHQLKGIDVKEGKADVANPLITFTLRTLTNGKQEFQIIYTYPTNVGKPNVYLARVPLEDFLGHWVQVEEVIKFDMTGEYSVSINRLDCNVNILEIINKELILWRNNAFAIRPKWGLYRNFGMNGSFKHLLKDECLKFADFSIIKIE